MLTQRDLLDYEIRSSWWCRYVSSAWLRTLASRYFAWKVNRKHRRYKSSLEILALWESCGKPTKWRASDITDAHD